MDFPSDPFFKKTNIAMSKDNKFSNHYPSVAIIILNWNTWRDTIECLESLQKVKYPNFRMLVVDNGSTNDSVIKIMAWWNEIIIQDAKIGGIADKITIIRNAQNFGYCEGNNIGIDHVLNSEFPPDFVFFLNNDARLDQNCLYQCVMTAIKNNAGMVGAVPKSADGSKCLLGDAKFPRALFYPRKSFFPSDLPDSWVRDAVPGSGMLVRSDVLIEMKSIYNFYLNPDLFMYWDEMDFCVRAKKLGYKILMSGNAIIFHGMKSQLHGIERIPPYYYIARNGFLLGKELLSFYIKIIFYLYYPNYCLIRIIKKLIQSEKCAAFAILEGLKDGFRGIKGKWKYHDKYYKNFDVRPR